MILYHVTKRTRLDDILEYGIKPIKGYVYFTDKEGIDTIIQYWVFDINAIILEVDIPQSYIKSRPRLFSYGHDAYALEWKTKRIVKPEYIKRVIEYNKR